MWPEDAGKSMWPDLQYVRDADISTPPSSCKVVTVDTTCCRQKVSPGDEIA